MAFAVCLGIIFIFELAVGIASIAFKSDLEQSINRSLQVSIQRRSQADMIAWDPLQRRLKCCGVLGAKDWYTSNNATIPVSCCRPDHIDYTIGDCKNAASFYSDRYYAVSFAILSANRGKFNMYSLLFSFKQEGCVSKLRERVEDNAQILIGVGIGICFLQIFGIFLACWLASAIKREKE